MTQISVSELKANAGKYVSMVGTKSDKVEAARALFGLLHASIDPDEEREERLYGLCWKVCDLGGYPERMT
ncbi:MAG: hypothetical protein IKS66_03730 [Oscillospiraceae bacterium]|nr:hypothetical protein [Oscillospiraceae bacterium]